MRSWPLTARGFCAVVLIVVCTAVGEQLALVELFGFAVLLAALLVGSALSIRLARPRATVTRVLSPELPAAGAPVHVEVTIAARSLTSLPNAQWREKLSKNVSADATGFFPSLRVRARTPDGRTTVVVSYTATVVHRGTHTVGPLRVQYTDPFGLTRHTVTLGAATTFLAAPAVTSLSPVAASAGDAAGSVAHETAHRGQGTDNLIARPYAPGDSMRRIHWRASAHRDELMVREEEAESVPEASVVFDASVARFSPEAQYAIGSDDDFEAAVSTCVSTVARLARDGFVVSVSDSRGAPLCGAIDSADSDEMHDLIVALSTLTASGRSDRARSDLPRTVHGVARGAGLSANRGPLMCVTGELDPTDIGAFVALGAEGIRGVLLTTTRDHLTLAPLQHAGWSVTQIGNADADLQTRWRDVMSSAHGQSSRANG